ncbi:MAG: molybdenum cofactor guanylyltransferase [Candidatus Omnitrophica bacterium]|nr:molybdenum cofactor guanylyltransferase [Candidatus Omnitrophota bacterium]
MNNKITGAILSGGRNSRMGGRNKAFMEVNGISILDRTAALFKTIFNEIIIVTNSQDEYSKYSGKCTIITDIIKNIGPLGGIHAALSTAKNNAVFFAACDMPNLHNEIIISQIDCYNKIKCDALVPRIKTLIEPLHAIYKKHLKDSIEAYLKNSNNYSIKDFLKTVKTAYLDMDDFADYKKIFKNINTPNDIL